MARRNSTGGCVAFGWIVLMLLGAPGCPSGVNPLAPPDRGDLTVVAAADPDTVRESESVSLRASASGGVAPYVYRWRLNDGPEDAAPSDTFGEQVTAGPFTTAGRYVYRVVATDAEGRTAVDFVTVEVEAAIVVSVMAEETEVLEGASVAFSTDVTDGVAPFSYAWSLSEGPIELDLSGETDDTLNTPPLNAEGDYTFEVRVEDAEGFAATASATITVGALFSIEAPPLLIVGEPGPLSVDFTSTVDGPSFLWEVIEGSVVIDEPSIETPSISATVGETSRIALTVSFFNESDQEAEVTHETDVVSAETTRPRVLIDTNFGDIVLELNADAAPRTTANFLAYVDAGFYDGVLFHRNACSENPDTGVCEPFVLQGGGYVREGDEFVLKEPTRDPVPSEAGNGLSNGALYSVAMALSGGDADSAQTQFFINLDDNAFLDDQNFTVFASVVEGRDVVDAIVAMERTDSPILPGEVSLPVEDVIMERVVRIVP